MKINFASTMLRNYGPNKLNAVLKLQLTTAALMLDANYGDYGSVCSMIKLAKEINMAL